MRNRFPYVGADLRPFSLLSCSQTSANAATAWPRIRASASRGLRIYSRAIAGTYNNNNNNNDNVYGADIMAEPMREFTRFIWWM